MRRTQNSTFSAFLINMYLEHIPHSMYMQISLNNNVCYTYKFQRRKYFRERIR